MALNANNLVSIINSNRDKRTSAKKLIESNPSNLPVHSKLVADKERSAQVETDWTHVNRGQLEAIHRRISCVKTNNSNIIELFPDIELAIQILVSSILAPKTMSEAQLNYRLDKSFEMNTELSSIMMTSISEYVNKEYELEDILPDIVREALFTSGAAVYGIIPEASVDDVINADLLHGYSLEDYKERIDLAMESMTSPRNILTITNRAPKKLSSSSTLKDLTEHMVSEDLVNLTDNSGMLFLNKLKTEVTSKILKRSVMKGGFVSQESRDKVNYLDVFRDRGTTSTNHEMEFIKTKAQASRKSLGRPMVTKFPTESVIPVFSPGNNKDHVGYFVILDENGKPLANNLMENSLNRLNSTLHSSSNDSSPIRKAYKGLMGNSKGEVDIDSLFEMYRTVLEKQLFSSVKSSLYGKDVELSEKNDIYYLMFTRALMEQRTSLLFIPKENVVYYTFQYNEMGIGKSLLENLAVQSSLRAILLFAKVMAYAKQSIDVTKVNISLDPDDPDPEKTIEQVQASVLKLRQNFLPLGRNNPIDLVNWIHRAGLQFSYENNPRLPDVDVSFENNNISHTLPDSDLEEDLRKQSIIALGLPPETIDEGFSPDFAKSVINNNILLSKRVTLYQKKLNKDNSKFVSTIVQTDETLRESLKEIILGKLDTVKSTLTEEEKQLLDKDQENFINYYLDKLAESLSVELPKPEDTDITNLSQEFEVYKAAVDLAIDSIVSDEIFSEDLAGESSSHIDSIKNVWKHHLLRKWMADNNFMSEVLDISTGDRKDGDALVETLSKHLVHTLRNSGKLMRLMSDFKEALDQDLEKSFNGESPEGGDSSYSDSGSDDDSADDEGGDDEGGEDEEDVDDMLSF